MSQISKARGYVIWFPRTRSYLSISGHRTGAETLGNAKLFECADDAKRAAAPLGYPGADGQMKSEPFEVNPVVLHLLREPGQ